MFTDIIPHPIHGDYMIYDDLYNTIYLAYVVHVVRVKNRTVRSHAVRCLCAGTQASWPSAGGVPQAWMVCVMENLSESR